MSKTILSLCDYSGNWSKYYREAGYSVIQVDLKLNGDVRLFPSQPSSTARLPSEFMSIEELGKVHGILAAPVCTVFSGSGACHRRSDAEISEGLALVDACVRLAWVLKPAWWVLENPVGKLRKWLGAPLMSFNPCDYGDPYKKKTLLWGDFNINLPRNPVEPQVVCEQGSWVQQLGGRSERTKELRSATPLGFAKAFFEANP